MWSQPVSPESGIANVRGADGRQVGMAFAVRRRQLVTCAHVVNAALGRQKRDSSPPGQAELCLEFLFGGSRDDHVRLPARVISWLPSQGSFDLHDVAALQVDVDMPDGVEVLPVAVTDPRGPVQMFGPSATRTLSGHVSGKLLGKVDDSRLQVNQELRGVFRVGHGFSGGPVWQPSTGQVVGLLQAFGADDAATDAYVLGAGLIAEACQGLPDVAITVLHLADLRFGGRDRGEGGDFLAGGRAGESLPERLLADLAEVGGGSVTGPDLVVVAGNTAEQARKTEYDAAYEFLAALGGSLKLGADRIVIVPGSRDVNRESCRRYFHDAESAGQAPVEPYWPKWQPYEQMYTRLYGVEFRMDRPWRFLEFPALRLAVAGLNSTIAETHIEGESYGLLGPEQLEWFAERMAKAEARGWFRLGVVHHSPRRGGRHQSATHLRDAGRFDNQLAPKLNMVLHGQPGTVEPGNFASARYILGLGSKGARSGDGPGPMQYQLVRINRDHIQVWTGSYDRERRQWVSGGGRGGNGYSEKLAKFTEVDTVFPPPVGSGPDRAATTVPHGEYALADDPNPDDLLGRMAEVCRLRHPEASVRVVRFPGGALGYLHVGVVRTLADGRRAPVEQYPIGACQGTPTDEDVDRFVADVCVRYFTDAAPLSYQLVYDGQHADPEVRARALRRNVELLSFAEYQLGYDLRPYAKRQHERLARDTLYPPELYVPQRYTEIEGYGAPADTPEVHADLLERLKGWLAEPDGHLVVVLGQFGHGKTFLLRELTRRMYTEGNSAVPVLVHLRDLEKSHNLDVLVASQLVQGGERRIDLALFKYLLYEGRIALLFDGFDELAVKVTYEAAKRHLDNILQAIEGRAKVVLVSRSQFFLTDAEVLSALGDRLATVAGRRLVKLVEFNDDQIAEFLRNRLGDEGAVSRLRLLKDVQDLHGLSRNPRMLDFITRIEEKDLLKARDSSGEITNAGLYRELLWEWLHYEQRRKEWPSGLPTLSQLFHAVTVLARRLWDSAAEDLGVSVLDDTADELARLSEDDEGAAPGARPDPDETTHLIGSGTLLVRDSEERFNFIHQSVMEWLVANHVADQIKEGEPVSELIRREMSPLMVDFLCGLLGRDAARYWAKSELAAPGASKWSRENALLVHKHLGEEIAADARLAGTDLSGKDLFKQVLPGTDLTLANLTEVSLVDADLSGANLEGARLVRARLDRSMLAGANLRGADLTGASLLGADVSGADLADATLRGAALLGSNIGADALAALPEAATWGAALPSDELPQLQYRSCAVGMRTVAVGPGLVASGGDDGVLRIWDPVAGAELREWTGHPDEVLSVDFTADGRLLASGGAGGQVRIWDPITGRRVLWLQAHTGRVWSVGFSRDGRRLASAGGDTVVRVWDPATGELEKELAGHEGVVWSVRFSPDGRQLASAGDGQMVRIWDPASGKLMGEWQAHDSAVLGVAFSPAGTLATAGADTVVRTWDPGTGDRIHELTGHTAPVCSVAYSADGRWLASAGDDGVVRIWNAATGVCLRELADHEGEVNSVGFATDGRWLASTGTDLVVRIWDPDTGTLVRRWGGHTDEVNSVGFSSDGRLIAAVGNDRMVRIWNAATGKLERELAGHTGRVWSMGFAPAGRWLATAGADGVVRLWDPATGAPEAELVGHIGRVRSLRFTADGRRLASAGDDGKVRIWDPADGSQTLEWTAHSSRVRALAYTTDGRWLASAGDDGMVRIWNPTAGGLIREWVGAAGAVWSVSFSPDGEILAGGGTDGMVRVWNPATGEELNRWPGQTGAVASVALSPDGRHLMSAGTIGIVRIWDPATGEQQHELVGHTGAVWSTGFSPDGRWVVSGGADSVVRIWEAATGAQRIAMLPLTDGWAALGPSPAAVHRYKLQGSPTGEFWYVQGLCRFEPGELDQYLERRIERIRPDAPLSDD